MSNAERMKDISNTEERVRNGFSPNFPYKITELAERGRNSFLERRFPNGEPRRFPCGEYSVSKMSTTLEEIPLRNSSSGLTESQNHSFPGASKPLKGSGKFNDPVWKEKQEKYMKKYQVQEIPKFQHHPAGDYTEAASKVPARMRSLDKERKEMLDKTMKEPTEKVGAFKEAYRAMTHKKDRW